MPKESIDALNEEMLSTNWLQHHVYLYSSELNGEASSSVGVELCSNWEEIGRMKTLDGRPRFPHLTSLAKCVLSLPVSNADTERVFSNVIKIVTDYRTEMEPSTLCALLSCKLNSNVDCFELETPLDLLRNAKRATMNNGLQ